MTRIVVGLRARMPMLAVLAALHGCATMKYPRDVWQPARDRNAASRDEDQIPATRDDQTIRASTEESPDNGGPSSIAVSTSRPADVGIENLPADLSGPQPVDALIRIALNANPTVRAAHHNVVALRHRIPQVTALDDPILSNTIFPIPSVAPQYSLMGYMPYSALLAQQFPWCGTLRLRGEAAAEDVRIALYELAAAQLDVIAGVKRAYHDLHFNEKAIGLLKENRKLAEDFLRVARDRYRLATATQVDVIRAEVAISDIDREIENTGLAENEARSELARLLHVAPGTSLQTVGEIEAAAVPKEVERLHQLILASRPELQGRLAAIARDEKAVALARKRYYPNLTVGLVYQDMEKTNAMTPQTAGGMPNVGLFVGMNLPIYRKKIAAGVCEAQARAAADAQLLAAERDQAHREINELFVQAKVQHNVLSLLRKNNLPASRRILDLTASDYRAGNAGVDYLSLINAWRELLQVQLQVAQVEAELGKSLAALERAVGTEINEHPPAAEAAGTPPAAASNPFQPRIETEGMGKDGTTTEEPSQ